MLGALAPFVEQLVAAEELLVDFVLIDFVEQLVATKELRIDFIEQIVVAE